ncbi:MAG: hypothetical protein JSS32_08120 [Verrucomicrobia bacterium]|nr:hypothetical protein [Verrucomicrobiota bacterium]
MIPTTAASTTTGTFAALGPSATGAPPAAAANDPHSVEIALVPKNDPNYRDHLVMQEEQGFEPVILGSSIHSSIAYVVNHDKILDKNGQKMGDLFQKITAEMALQGKKVIVIWPTASRIDYVDIATGEPDYVDISQPKPNSNHLIENYMAELSDLYHKEGFPVSTFGEHERGDNNGLNSFELVAGRVPKFKFGANQLNTALGKLSTPEEKVKVLRKLHTAHRFIEKLGKHFDDKITAFQQQVQADPTDKAAKRNLALYEKRREKLKELEQDGSQRAAMNWALSHPNIESSFEDLRKEIEAAPGPAKENFRNMTVGKLKDSWIERDQKIAPHELQDIVDTVLLDVNDSQNMQEERFKYKEGLNLLEKKLNREITARNAARNEDKTPADSLVELKKKRSSFAQLVCKLTTVVEDVADADPVTKHAEFSALGVGLPLEEQQELTQTINNIIGELNQEKAALDAFQPAAGANDQAILNGFNDAVTRLNQPPQPQPGGGGQPPVPNGGVSRAPSPVFGPASAVSSGSAGASSSAAAAAPSSAVPLVGPSAASSSAATASSP